MMQRIWVRWLVMVAAMGACTLVALSALPSLRSARGVPGPAVVDAVQPAWAAVRLLLACAGCTLVAAIAGRLLNAVVGLFAMGVGLGILAMRTGTIRDACFDGGSLGLRGAETIAWGILAAIASAIVFRVSGPLPDTRRDPAGGAESGMLGAESLRMAATGALALVGIWLLVSSPLKGQSLGAVALGGVLVGNVARKVAPGVDPVWIFATPILALGVAQAVLGSSLQDPAGAYIAGTLPNLLVPMPLDAVAATLVGVAFGFGLSRPVQMAEIAADGAPARVAGPA